MSPAPAAQALPVAFSPDLYPRWADADGNCRNTRAEVLIAESLVPVTFDASGCTVVAGEWRDAFTGRAFTAPDALVVVPIVPLAEAHISGAAEWSADKRASFANDLERPETLAVVARETARARGASDPTGWLPATKPLQCAYAQNWIIVKEHWELTLERAEALALRGALTGCPRPG